MVNSYIHNQTFPLESGEALASFKLEYSTIGRLSAKKDNVVWICHALTGNANPESWWSGLVGKNKQFDPEKHFIICANTLGSHYGSTGPLSINRKTGECFFHEFPIITIRDIVRSFDFLRNHLQLPNVNILIGGSFGGQLALEWAIQQPKVFSNLILIATNAKHSPWGIAFNESQRLAIQSDSSWQLNTPSAGLEGLKAARSFALLSYRNYEIYNRTQADVNCKIDNYKASSYQQYQGSKFVNRFNAFSYFILSKAMDSHDVSRNRMSMKNALSKVSANTIVIAIDSDILFPISESKFLAEGIENSELHIINSIYGHDGFLIETNQIQEIITGTFIHQQKNN